MRIKWALKIDRLAGAPLGWGLRLLSGLHPRPRRAPGPLPPPRNIIVIKCLGFGSIVQMAPMLATLRETWPDARIRLLTFRQNEGLGALMPFVDHVACIEFRGGALRWIYETILQISRLRALRPELVLDTEFFSYYVAFLTRFIAGRTTVTVGYFNNRRSKDWIFTHAVAIDLSEHIAESFQKSLSPLGMDAPARPLEECGFAVPPAARASLEGKLQALGVQANDTLVVVNINASDLCLNRRWPMERFQALVRTLADSTPAYFIFIGAPEDRDYVAQCVAGLKEVPRVHDLAGQTTLTELAALLSRATLFVGNDSGPLHLAEAFGVHSISFFGPETPNLYGPRGPRHTVFYTRPFCSPCLNAFYAKDNNCTNNICLQGIAVPEVVRSIRSAIPSDASGI